MLITATSGAVDIGITWADNETFLHGVRVVGTKFSRPTGQEPVMSTPYPEGRNDDRGSSPMTGRPSSPETLEFGPETIPIARPAVDHLHRLVICRVVARDRTPPYHLNQRDGTSNPTTDLLVTATTVRETLSRSGHHPHRSIHTSSGPFVIFIHHIDLVNSVTGYRYHT